MLGKAKANINNIDTLISSKVELTGNLHFSGGIQIEGRVIGNIVADDESSAVLRITEKGYVEGEIRVPKVIINGKVNGDVYSTDHVELAAKACVTGNVYYNLIEMVMGAEVNGSLMHSGGKVIETEKPKSAELESSIDVGYSAIENT